MTFKNKYSELLNRKKQNLASLSEESAGLIDCLDVPDKWFEAMAVCEAAVDAGNMDENILNLRHRMFLGEELHSGMMLDDEDYAEWFEQAVNFNIKLAGAGIVEAWAELSSIYNFARFPHCDRTKAEEYMMKAVNLDNPLALSLYGYALCYGTGFAKLDREKGMSLILRAKEKNFERADMYLLLAEYESYTDAGAFVQKIIDYNSSAKPANRLWGPQGDIFLNHFGDIEKAVECYDRGINDSNNPYCKYKKAVLILNGRIEGDKNGALLMMENAYEWSTVSAADFLGQFYILDDEYRDTDKAVEWYKRAISYETVSSMVNLACFYLYDEEEHRNIDKGLEYLDMAIKNDSIRALSEKACFLLEGDEKYRDIPVAKKLLEEACEKGDGYAAYRLGTGYQNAEFSEKNDYAAAFNYYTLGAERDYLYAIELLGRYYRAGIAGEPNPEKAIELYRRALERDSNYARVELAICYEEGYGVEQDYNRALELLELAAADNYTYAHCKLGYCYLDDAAGEPDTDKAFEHFSIAAESGSIEAIYNLGRMYKYSVGRPENPELAIKYFGQAAEGGDPDANVEMGLAYEHEYGGLEFDGKKVMEYMAYAADRDHPYAQYKMGIYYYYGMIEEDIEKGLEYLYKAYDNGSIYAAAAIGDYFLYGRNEDFDSTAKAFQYYKYAADRDYVTEGIGLCCLYGIGTENSESEAFKYFMIAADNGITSAKFHLGLCYKYERGTTRNILEAYRWFTEAASEGNTGAGYETGMMLLKGEGVEMNPEKGIEWLRKAADEEYSDAQFELGNCYLIGEGVEEDELQAMYWYRKAAENGNENARKIVKKRGDKRR
jgi:TPR repeat protein